MSKRAAETVTMTFAEVQAMIAQARASVTPTATATAPAPASAKNAKKAKAAYVAPAFVSARIGFKANAEGVDTWRGILVTDADGREIFIGERKAKAVLQFAAIAQAL
jgi:hypothetical protein